MNRRSPIKLSRAYNKERFSDENNVTLPESYVYQKERNGFDLFPLIDFDAPCLWMDEYVLARLKCHAINDVKKLDIWDGKFVESFGSDPRGVFDRIIHTYLQKTRKKTIWFWSRGLIRY